jgi:hypothetical protein
VRWRSPVTCGDPRNDRRRRRMLFPIRPLRLTRQRRRRPCRQSASISISRAQVRRTVSLAHSCYHAVACTRRLSCLPNLRLLNASSKFGERMACRMRRRLELRRFMKARQSSVPRLTWRHAGRPLPPRGPPRRPGVAIPGPPEIRRRQRLGLPKRDLGQARPTRRAWFRVARFGVVVFFGRVVFPTPG